MQFTTFQLKKALRLHLEQSGQTLLELANKMKVETKVLSLFLENKAQEISPLEYCKVASFFSENNQWIIWQTKHYQRIMQICRSRMHRKGLSVIRYYKGTGCTTTLKDFALFYPDTKYFDTSDEYKKSWDTLKEVNKTQNADSQSLLIFDHLQETELESLTKQILKADVPAVLTISRQKSTKRKDRLAKGAEKAPSTHSFYSPNTKRDFKTPVHQEVECYQLPPLSLETVSKIAAFYGIDHPDDKVWLKKNGKSFDELKSRIHELKLSTFPPADWDKTTDLEYLYQEGGDYEQELF